MITIIDYGAGNLFSVQNALNFLGLENQVSSDPKDLDHADGLILPGVGAFPLAMEKLRETGLVSCIRENAQKKPLLGICLGMQMLFEESEEFTRTEGLSLIPGKIDKIVCPYKIPVSYTHLSRTEKFVCPSRPSRAWARRRQKDFRKRGSRGLISRWTRCRPVPACPRQSSRCWKGPALWRAFPKPAR